MCLWLYFEKHPVFTLSAPPFYAQIK